MTNVKIASKKGTTLAEVLMAVLLVALSIGGILGIVVQSLDFERSIDYTNSAINIARSRIERLRQIRNQRGYAALPSNAETDSLVDANGVSNIDGDFKRTTIIDTASRANLTVVTVRVVYKRKGAFISTPVELVTLISQYI